MRRPGLVLGAAFLFVAGGLACMRIARSWALRVAVSGHSMEPDLNDGDWLLVQRARGPLGIGQLAVVRDPRSFDRLLIKRVQETWPDGSATVAGDHPAHRGDAESIGRVPPELVIGRPRLRYWPVRRIALL